MRKLIRKTVIILALLLLCAAAFRMTAGFWARQAAGLLLVPDVLRKADCIVMLQGDLYPRAKKAAELYAQGYAPAIVVSPLKEREKELREYYYFEHVLTGAADVDSSVLLEKALGYFGKDMQGVYLTGIEGTSTFDEARATRELMQRKGFASMILVTNTYHMRRALWIFRRVFRGSGIAIYPVTAPHPVFDPGRWWHKEADADMIFREYLAFAHNFIYHFVLGKERTAFDS
jgi:uncharacterized SAM-binding protein YcdF (DUF218 family)